MIRLLVAILLLLPAGALAAEREYQIELLVFKHLAQSRAELPRLPDPVPVFTDRPELAGELDEPEEIELLPSGDYRIAARDNMLLRDTWGSLRRSRDFRPLYMTGWIQPGYGRDDALARRIVFRTDDGDEVAGYIKLIIERFVHVDADLTMRDAAGGSALLRESRRMKRDEIHYLDNPRFGMIAVVWRLDDPPEGL